MPNTVHFGHHLPKPAVRDASKLPSQQRSRTWVSHMHRATTLPPRVLLQVLQYDQRRGVYRVMFEDGEEEEVDVTQELVKVMP